ncbi:S8 family serine peptidase [Couchioplanes azureus]|uniref:S8 family serine peptidase n=1 Tax=Couchioplanes caeruleus TaxID=56438 RepID=UPI001670BE2B|nr:S8 family serine peptidase [Couchioplanes caeruleus]GGQ50920.1 peptidase S8 [Couchioplanes caeruleus subsp. azureus]
MSVHRRPGRALVAALALALTTVAVPAHAAPGDSKIEPRLRAQLAANAGATFWVVLRDRADLGPARRATGTQRAERVHRIATEHAARSQASVRALLTARRASFTPYWIANTVRVTGDARLAAAVAARPEVSRVLADKVVPLPKLTPAAALPRVRSGAQNAEWNLARVQAPRVWDDLSVRGDGIVVATVDTGVQYDHPALAASYRGRAADGTLRHDYSWFDPTGLCADGVPCDNAGHGTHTTGTMVGLDGDHAIGVAPGARWIAAKGCESNACSTASLLAAGQWIVAPTDRAGNAPRPDLAPDVVNNSWGGWGFDPWYAQIVDAWVAAGIFPAFSNGNAGPGCASAGSPGNYAAAYASGAHDPAGAIASFSSRGGGQDGTVKPDIAAPGVDVLSSVPGGYASYSGTSMASPHTAATVALLWSAVPGLRRDIATTRQVLDATATDTDDTSCGGTPADNQVYGEGRLDAYAAVSGARQPSGVLAGTVTAEGAALSGATVSVTGTVARQGSTGPDGAYRLALLPPGTYEATITRYGYRAIARTVVVAAGETARLEANLEPAPAATLTGTVTGTRGPVAGATVGFAGTPATTRTDAGGRFTLTAPTGRYELRVQPRDGCDGVRTRGIDFTGDTTVDLPLPAHRDAYGYSCAATAGGYAEGTRRLEPDGPDDGTARIDLPFPLPFYGDPQLAAWVSVNGQIAFGGPETAFTNLAIPDPLPPNHMISAFWDDLYVDELGGIYTASGADTVVVEWRNVRFYGDPSQRISISVVLGRDGTIAVHHRGLQGALADGGSATIGIENADGTDGLQFSYGAGVVSEGGGVTFRPPGAPRLRGR